MMLIEAALDDIARHLSLDPLSVRQVNFYGDDTRNLTPYHMLVEHNLTHLIVDDLVASSDYLRRRQALAAAHGFIQLPGSLRLALPMRSIVQVK